VLLDCKRGDIGSTAAAYAVASYDKLLATGVTLSPLMGYDSVSPFLTGDYAGKGGAFVLCKTSNPGSSEILSGCFEKIARLASDWSLQANGGDSSKEPCLGLVVGATDPDALKRSRKAAPGLWLLSPGVGAQGGDLDAACEAGLDASGGKMLIPVSRGISRAEDRGEKARELRDNINGARRRVVEGRGGGDEIEAFQRDFIDFSLEMGVLKFGTFTLKSGRER
jgi:uridine monophosphate synthetase